MTGELHKRMDGGLFGLADTEDVCPESARCGECVEAVRRRLLDALADTFNAGFAEGARGSIECDKMPNVAEWPRFEDGEPVRVGDAADFEHHGTATVTSICFDGELAWVSGDCGAEAIAFRPGERVGRPKPQDEQRRIDADAAKNFHVYWGCGASSCDMCPTRRGGKTPAERYGCDSCAAAQKLDLLRRQRELDGRKA